MRVHDIYTQSFVALSDSSLNGTYRGCPRRLEFRKLYGHARAERAESLPTGAGEALHRAWQEYINSRNKHAAIWELMANFPIQLQDRHTNYRSLQACYMTLEEMIAHPIDSRYRLATVMHNGHERPAVEVPFRITFNELSVLRDRNIPIYYDGFIDAILWDTVEQNYVVVDIKTTRIDRHDYTAKFSRDPQCLPYAYVLQKALGQSAEWLRVIYFVAFIDLANPRVQQLNVEKTQRDIEEWAFQTAFDLNAIRQYAEMGFFPRNGKECDGWRVCDYYDVCDYTDPDAIRRWLDLRYGETDNQTVLDNFDPWFTINLKIEGLV